MRRSVLEFRTIGRIKYWQKWIKIKHEKDHEANHLGLFFIFALKFWICFIIQKLSKRQYDYEVNFLILILGITTWPLRNFILTVIRYWDKKIPPYFGALHSNVERYVQYKGTKLRLKSTQPGLDLRLNMWKHEALDIIISDVKNNNLKELNFMEIGAASGIVTLMLGMWAKKNNIVFHATCIEPSFANVDFLEKMATQHGINVQVIPCAIDDQMGWIEFSDAGHKGFVGAAAKGSTIIQKLTMSIEQILEISKRPNLIYIDAYLNEGSILKSLLSGDPNGISILTEFDYGLPVEIKNKCLELGLLIQDVDDIHYMIKG